MQLARPASMATISVVGSGEMAPAIVESLWYGAYTSFTKRAESKRTLGP